VGVIGAAAEMSGHVLLLWIRETDPTDDIMRPQQ
jgi:hypothetical protein